MIFCHLNIVTTRTTIARRSFTTVTAFATASNFNEMVILTGNDDALYHSGEDDINEDQAGYAAENDVEDHRYTFDRKILCAT